MCGIVGYVGSREAAPILLDGLRHLEYRGYDSAGVAVVSNGQLGVLRSAGKLSNLNSLINQRPLAGFVGLGHTRWATHGRPSEENAHPHTDCSRKLAVIHNGIIENYMPLKKLLEKKGHAFQSATDTEVLAHLIEEKLKEMGMTASTAPQPAEPVLREAIRMALKEIKGSYALAVLWSEAPGVILAAKTDSPLVIGMGESENFMASDVPAFLKHTRKVVFLEDGELATMSGEDCHFFNLNGNKIEKTPTYIDWDSGAAEKAGYRHFMLKEIHEQPRAVENTLLGRLLPLRSLTLERETGLTPEILKTISQIQMIACGTSWHAGLVGKYLLERHAQIQTQVETASEFRYRKPVLAPGTLITAISQSGETADTLAAIRLAKKSGSNVLAICNTVGSAITRASDFNLYTRCGPECGVASTKAFIGQLIALNILTLHAALERGTLQEKDALEWAAELQRLPDLVKQVLPLNEQIQKIAKEFSQTEHFLYIGRGINYPVALEGALKLKEIAYIHAEGYPAGELKHGPLALVHSEMPVLVIATQSDVLEKTLSNVQEIKARGGKIIALCTQGDERLEGVADHILSMPAVSESLSPILNVIPLQFLAYYMADLRGCDVDQPRNLAKSVTVE